LDENLLKEIRSNPEEGLLKLMDTYMGLVYTIVRNKLAPIYSKEDIEECVSTVFYDFYRQRDSIDLSKGSIKSFLAVIAKRRSVDLYRAGIKKIHPTDSLDSSPNIAVLENSTVDTETKHALIQSIKDLGIPDSEIFIRKYYFGQSSKTIAKALGIKVNTIYKKISRGLVKLKNALGGVL
jgi:RNA polymerase sigma-70 factor (ECF subfamily)